MIVKYQVKGGAVSVGDICDISKDGTDVILMFVNPQLMDIIIKNISDSEYERIISDAYYYGKIDLTKYHNSTFFEKDE